MVWRLMPMLYMHASDSVQHAVLSLHTALPLVSSTCTWQLSELAFPQTSYINSMLMHDCLHHSRQRGCCPGLQTTKIYPAAS